MCLVLLSHRRKNRQARAWPEMGIPPILLPHAHSVLCSHLAPTLCGEGEVLMHYQGAKKSAGICMEQLNSYFFFFLSLLKEQMQCPKKQ